MTQDTTPEPMPIDQYVDLVKRWREASKARHDWGKIEDKLKAELESLLGKQNGTINGQLAVERKPVDQFRTNEFKKDNPERAQFYTRKKLTSYVDIDELREKEPELYDRYRTIKTIYHGNI